MSLISHAHIYSFPTLKLCRNTDTRLQALTDYRFQTKEKLGGNKNLANSLFHQIETLLACYFWVNHAAKLSRWQFINRLYLFLNQKGCLLNELPFGWTYWGLIYLNVIIRASRDRWVRILALYKMWKKW